MGSGVLGSATIERWSREVARVSQEAVEVLKEDIIDFFEERLVIGLFDWLGSLFY